MSKTFLKLTETKAAVKIAGSGLTETLTLATDLKSTTQVVLGGAVPTVSIVAAHWTGEANATATITRGGVVVMDLQANAAAQMFFQDQEFTDTIGSTSDIVVTTTGRMQIYLVLRKMSGYTSKVEPEKYGPYDDPTRVGASTTMSGSPDFGG